MSEAEVVESVRQWALLISVVAGIGVALVALCAAVLWWADRPLSDDRLFRLHYQRERERLARAARREKCRGIRADAVRLARDEARAGR